MDGGYNPRVMPTDDTRRRFLATCTGLGLGGTLAPGVLWARMQDAGADRVTLAMVTDALKLSGIELADADRQALVDGANSNLERLDDLRAFHIPNDVSPPYHFSPVVAGMKVDRARRPWVLSKAPALKRPARLEDVAFWPLRHLAELVRTRQVTSVELTRMYLERLHRYHGRLNNVVTFLDDLGLAEAAGADREIAAGRYKGPLHGLPWGCKDIITVKGFKTTWGSPAFTEQQFDYDASVVEMLRDAGAVLIAKLATGELAAGDNWFGGQTKSPWDSDAGIERVVGRPGLGHRGRVRRLRHRHRNERVDPEPGGALRRGRPAADLRPDQPLRRDGAVVDAGSARTVLPPRRRLRGGDAGGRQARRPRHERDRSAVQLGRRARRPDAEGRHPPGVVRRADRAGRQGQRHGHARGAARDSE